MALETSRESDIICLPVTAAHLTFRVSYFTCVKLLAGIVKKQILSYGMVTPEARHCY